MPLLVVIDQAETRADLIAKVMRTLWAADSRSPARVLLLARSAGDWWRQLTDKLDEPADTVTVLPGLDPSEDRAARFGQAAAALCKRLPELRPDTDWNTIKERVEPPADLDHSRYASPLTLQLTALTALLVAADPASGYSDEPAEQALLRHERTYWESVAERYAFFAAYQGEPLRDAVATASLAGAGSQDEALPVLEVLLAPNDRGTTVAPQMSRWLRELYPPTEDRWWGALQPDRLAEYQTAARLAESPGLLSAILGAASAEQVFRAMTVLARILVNPAITDQRRDELADQLGQALVDYLERYGPAAIAAATEAPDPSRIVAALEHATRDAAPVSLESLAAALPERSVALDTYSLQVAKRLVQSARAAATEDDPETLHVLAQGLNGQYVRLAAVGLREEALDVAQEAVGLFDRLVEDDQCCFTSALAGSLINESRALAELGRRPDALEAAEEAVARYAGWRSRIRTPSFLAWPGH